MYDSNTADCPVSRDAGPGPAPDAPPPGRRPMKVLYVSFTDQTIRPYLDPSTRYRCFSPVEGARALGHEAFVRTHATLGASDPALFDMVVVHRPAATPELVRFLRAGRAAGTRLVADYDDLIFDPAHAEAAAKAVSTWDLAAVFDRFKQNKDALGLFGEFTVSTAPLRDHILAQRPGAAVQVLPNAVLPSLWSMIAGRGYQNQPDRPYVGYFPNPGADRCRPRRCRGGGAVPQPGPSAADRRPQAGHPRRLSAASRWSGWTLSRSAACSMRCRSAAWWSRRCSRRR